LNLARRSDQAKIVKQAIIQAEKYDQDPVLVVSAADWSHGIVGIVASKLLEKYQKPVFVLQEMGDESKGSARSYGDFSVADAINASRDIVKKGGGHKLAAGVTLPTENIEKFRKRVNDFYKSSQLSNQKDMLLPQADADADLDEITEELVNLISGLEPFGNGNPEPIIRSKNLKVVNVRKMGNDNQHVKLELQNRGGRKMQFVAFGAPKHFFVGINANVTVWYQSTINEWQGNRSVEGRLLHLIVEE